MVKLNVWIYTFCRWSDVFMNTISKTGMFIYIKLEGRCARLIRSTGFTANPLMLGREVNKSADLLFGIDKANKYPDYVLRLKKFKKGLSGLLGKFWSPVYCIINVIMINDTTRLLTILVLLCVYWTPVTSVGWIQSYNPFFEGLT